MKSPQYLILPTPWATPSPITLPLYSVCFTAYRLLAERQQLKFNSNNSEAYNAVFSMDELSKAITKSSVSAVGPDDIHYQIFQNLLYQLFFTSLTNTGAAKAFLPSGIMQSFYQYQRLTKIKLTHAATAR